MFPFKFNCNGNPADPLLKQLHGTFQATPFLPPSNGIKLLDLVMHRGQKTHHLGPFQKILKDAESPLDIPARDIKMAGVELNRTTHFNFDLGLQLLEGIFKGFNLEMEPLKAVLKREGEMALSFQNVRRRSIPHTVMGSALAGRRVMNNHSSVKMMRAEKYGSYIISSVLESKQFSIHLIRGGSQSLDVEAPSINALAAAGLEVSGDKKNDLLISHTGKNYLTFAFSCFELNFQDNGAVAIWEEVTWSRGKGLTEESDEPTEPEACDSLEISFMHPKLPAILAWDDYQEG